MQTLPRLANPHKRTGWLKTCQILGLVRNMLFGGVGEPEFEKTFQEGACGWAERETLDLPLLQGSDEMGGLHSSLGQPQNNRAANNTGCE